MSEGKREKKREFPEAPPKRFSKRGKTLPPLSLSPFLSYLHRHHHRARLLRLVPRHDGEDGVGVQSRDPLVFARKGLARPAARGLGHEDDEAVRVGGERGVELLGAVDLSYFCGVEKVRGRATSVVRVGRCVFHRERREKRDDDDGGDALALLFFPFRFSFLKKSRRALCGPLPLLGRNARMLPPEIDGEAPDLCPRASLRFLSFSPRTDRNLLERC